MMGKPRGEDAIVCNVNMSCILNICRPFLCIVRAYRYAHTCVLRYCNHVPKPTHDSFSVVVKSQAFRFF